MADLNHYVVFHLDSALYAIPVAHVNEVFDSLKIDHIAGAPSFVQGMTVIRGKALSVFDLRSLMDVQKIENHNSAYMIVTIPNATDSYQCGLAVDTVVSVETFDDADIQEVEILEGISSHYISGVVVRDQQTIQLINPATLLAGRRSTPAMQKNSIELPVLSDPEHRESLVEASE